MVRALRRAGSRLSRLPAGEEKSKREGRAG
jgi:hypothetical protein